MKNTRESMELSRIMDSNNANCSSLFEAIGRKYFELNNANPGAEYAEFVQNIKNKFRKKDKTSGGAEA